MSKRSSLASVLAKLKLGSIHTSLARRVNLDALLTPIASGGGLPSLEFLYASTRRNRFTPQNGAKTLYLGEDEDVGSAETKRIALLGDFARVPANPASVFWVRVQLNHCVLDLTKPSVLRALGVTDGKVYDPDWRDKVLSTPERIGAAAFKSKRIAAIKFWSVRSATVGKRKFCLCIFKDRISAPNLVELANTSGTFKESWP